jgi:hypothetical protein
LCSLVSRRPNSVGDLASQRTAALIVEGHRAALAHPTREASEAWKRSGNRAATDNQHDQPIETAERLFTTECVTVPEERTPHCTDPAELDRGSVEVGHEHEAETEEHYAENENCDAREHRPSLLGSGCIAERWRPRCPPTPDGE